MVIISLLFILSSVGAQDPYEDDQYVIELDQGWNSVSIPASQEGYSVQLEDMIENSERRCELAHGYSAFSYEGEGTESSVIEAQRGYSFYIENSGGCEMVVDQDDLFYYDQYSGNSVEKVRTDSGWNVLSVPEKMDVSEYEDTVAADCSLEDSVDSGVKVYEIDPIDYGNNPLEASDTMYPERTYWIDLGSSCDLDLSDYVSEGDETVDEEPDPPSGDTELDSVSDDHESGWSFSFQPNSVDASKSDQPEYSFDSISEGTALSIRGNPAVCGEASMEKTFSPYSPTNIDRYRQIDVEVSIVDQGTSSQTFFISENGEVQFESSIPGGETREFSYNAYANDKTVRFGLKESSPNTCYLDSRSTDVEVLVSTSTESTY